MPMNTKATINTWLDRPLFPFWPRFTIYHIIVILILVTAVLSRFIILGERVMSHDEVNHVVPAYTFYTGGGYRYDPVTHGPLQFHLITLSYTLFGDSDFSARIPDALFGIAVVVFAIFAFKDYLGRVGALVAGFLFTISPFISFYSRYTRNEIYIVFWGMVLIWGVLRYLEHGRKRTLLLITVITALHFTDKATSYIFTAELLIFLAVVFIARIITKPWQSRQVRLIFSAVVALTLVVGLALFGISYNALTNAPEAEGNEGVGVMFNELPSSTRLLIGILGLVFLASLVAAIIFLIQGIRWRSLRDERSFDLLILQGTIVLPPPGRTTHGHPRIQSHGLQHKRHHRINPFHPAPVHPRPADRHLVELESMDTQYWYLLGHFHHLLHNPVHTGDRFCDGNDGCVGLLDGATRCHPRNPTPVLLCPCPNSNL